jgi:hypothetical protein
VYASASEAHLNTPMQCSDEVHTSYILHQALVTFIDGDVSIHWHGIHEQSHDGTSPDDW